MTIVKRKEREAVHHAYQKAVQDCQIRARNPVKLLKGVPSMTGEGINT
jgi:hypothetical protein